MRHPLTRPTRYGKNFSHNTQRCRTVLTNAYFIIIKIITVGNQNINRFVKFVGSVRVQGDQSSEIY